MGNDENPPDFREEDGKVFYSFYPEGINFRKIGSLILLIGFYYGISELLRNFQVPNKEKSHERIDNLLEKFRNIYSQIFGSENVNSILLKKDIERLEHLIRKEYLTTSFLEKWLKLTKRTGTIDLN